MEYLALYRKYRPKELDEVVGQSEIKKILARSVKNGTITHAYLFSGPRGTGKTTMAKILAKMVNCLNPVDGHSCNECDNCLNVLNSNDVIEIDAASNNGVDEIRELREKASLVPSFAKYKVYIIDEVHMLTTQAFNALLKTLEEPPKHVIFILATTEYHKIPLTITSRCQKFQFEKINNNDIVDRLKNIAKLENIKITDESLEEIAKISDGGMRDSINFLDQLRSFSNDEITIDDVYDVCGNVSSDELIKLFNNIRKNNCEEVTAFFENMNTNGKNYGKFLENTVEFLKDVILYKKNVNHKYIKSKIEAVGDVNGLFTDEEIFFMVDYINTLLDKLKNVSKHSTVVITTFLIIMDRIANRSINNDVKLEKNSDVNNEYSSVNSNYDMAFEFTSTNNSNDDELTDDEVNASDNNENYTDIKINDNAIKNKEIIINNTFAVADKNIKNNLQNYMAKLDSYFTDKKYKVAASSLIDTKIEAAGNSYVILSALNDAIIEKIYNNYKICNELLNIIFDDEYNFVVLNQDEWNKYRDEYVLNFKNGKKYILKELLTNEDENVIKKEEPTIVDKLFDLVGEDIVEFK